MKSRNSNVNFKKTFMGFIDKQGKLFEKKREDLLLVFIGK